MSVIATVRSGSDVDDSLAGSVLGTPAYMAPEQASGEVEQVDRRADVFGLGSILCEILTGQPAYTGRNQHELIRKAMRGDTADARARWTAAGPRPSWSLWRMTAWPSSRRTVRATRAKSPSGSRPTRRAYKTGSRRPSASARWPWRGRSRNSGGASFSLASRPRVLALTTLGG